jgi:hypothetical protein
MLFAYTAPNWPFGLAEALQYTTIIRGDFRRLLQEGQGRP